MDRSFERQVSLRTAAKSGEGSWANYPLCSDAVSAGYPERARTLPDIEHPERARQQTRQRARGAGY